MKSSTKVEKTSIKSRVWVSKKSFLKCFFDVHCHRCSISFESSAECLNDIFLPAGPNGVVHLQQHRQRQRHQWHRLPLLSWYLVDRGTLIHFLIQQHPPPPRYVATLSSEVSLSLSLSLSLSFTHTHTHSHSYTHTLSLSWSVCLSSNVWYFRVLFIT